jgi:hypothetical protein
MHSPISRGQYTAAKFAAESYVGREYLVDDGAGGEYSANPADYWNAADDAQMGALIRLRHPFRTVTGRTLYAPRLIRSAVTVGDLRRLARAAVGLVR